MKPATASPDQEGLRVSRRDQLLDAASVLLNARGIGDSSFAAIAEQLGVTRQALYHYVEDREDLVFQCYRRSCEVTASCLARAVRVGDGDAIRIVSLFVDQMLDGDTPEIAALSEVGVLAPEQAEIVIAQQEGIVARLAGALEAGARAGQVRKGDFGVMARTILGVLHWTRAAKHWADDGDPRFADAPTAEEIRRTMSSLLIDGYARDRAQPMPRRGIDLSTLAASAIETFDRGTLAQTKREAILKSASRLFNAKGVDGASLDEIAAALRITKRSIYQHIGDKPALVAAAYVRAYIIFGHIQERAGEFPGPKADALFAFTEAICLAHQSPGLSPFFRMAGFRGLDEATQAAIIARTSLIREGLTAIRSAGVAEGSLRTVDLRALGLIAGGVSTWLVGCGERGVFGDPAHVAREVATLERIGLRAVP